MPFPSSMVGTEAWCPGEGGGFARRASARQADTDSLFLPPGRGAGVTGESEAGRQAVRLGPGFSPLSRVLGTLEMLGNRRAQGFGSLRKRESRGALPFSPAWTHLWGTLSPYHHGCLHQRADSVGVGRGSERAFLGPGTAVTSGSCMALGGAAAPGSVGVPGTGEPRHVCRVCRLSSASRVVAPCRSQVCEDRCPGSAPTVSAPCFLQPQQVLLALQEVLEHPLTLHSGPPITN